MRKSTIVLGGVALLWVAGCGDGDTTPRDDGGPADAAMADGDVFTGCQSDADCDDGRVCNGLETCDADGICQAGTPADDGVACTTESGVDGECIGGLCAPPDCGNGVLDGAEQCDDGQNGNDADGCQDDCTFTCEAAADCDDGDVCNGAETCDTASHTCEPGTQATDGTSCGSGMICVGGQCTAEGCGDGIVSSTEQCDDGDAVDGNGCDNDCTYSCEGAADCDDGVFCNGSETCDTTSHTCQAGTDETDGTTCTPTGGGSGTCQGGSCVPSDCGNGTPEAGEQCDDGDSTNGDGCDNDCTYSCEAPADCDDGMVCNGAEMCDTTSHTCQPGTLAPDGTTCGANLICLSGTCVTGTCGDGFVSGSEECDDGQDGDDTDGCTDACQWTCEADVDCDDGMVCNGTETCDTSTHTCQAGTQATDGTSCGVDMVCMGGVCTTSNCGDGVVDEGEQCDDGNAVDDDVCTNDCLLTDVPDGDPITADDTTWTYVPIEGAVCRDGSSTGIMVNLNSASDRVVIYLEGGGACFNFFTCSGNPSSFDPTGFSHSGGVFDRTSADNPVADWNFIYVPYCTGDVHAGDTESMVNGSLQQFRGYSNIELALERIVPTFPEATQVLLTGVSAGGFGAAANFEQVQRDFQDVPVVLFDDSGPPMSSEYIAPCLQQQWRETWGFDNTILRDCGADCPDPSDYVLDLAGHIVKRYPNNVGALFSNTEDGTIRTFYGFGLNNCMNLLPEQLSAADFTAGLADFRNYIQMRTSNFGTYYVEGNDHTCIDGSCLYSMSVEMVTLTDYLADLLAGSTSHVPATFP